jgi:hypothetical protein
MAPDVLRFQPSSKVLLIVLGERFVAEAQAVQELLEGRGRRLDIDPEVTWADLCFRFVVYHAHLPLTHSAC